MNEAEFNRLADIAMRRPLTDEEEGRLKACLGPEPAANYGWEEELGLTRLLHQLPDAPLASNFTAQVVRAVEGETRQSRRPPAVFLWLGLRRPAQRLAAVTVFLAIAFLSYFQYQTFARQKMAVALTNVARNVSAPAEITELPAIELWRDFNAIDLLDKTEPQADEELLVGLALK
jgi:anti-sigma factor RsiW